MFVDKGGASHGVAGNWRGRYLYTTGGADGQGFEAVFLQNDSRLEGNILDDGPLGEAVVTGSFVYPSINFTKVYRAGGQPPIYYSGTMSEDGKTLAGTWEVHSQKVKQPLARGTWTARRYDDVIELDMETLFEKQKELEEARPTVAPMSVSGHGPERY